MSEFVLMYGMWGSAKYILAEKNISDYQNEKIISQEISLHTCTMIPGKNFKCQLSFIFLLNQNSLLITPYT